MLLGLIKSGLGVVLPLIAQVKKGPFSDLIVCTYIRVKNNDWHINSWFERDDWVHANALVNRQATKNADDSMVKHFANHLLARLS